MKTGKFYTQKTCVLGEKNSWTGCEIIYDYQTGPDDFKVISLGTYKLEEIQQLQYELFKMIESMENDRLQK